MFENTMVMGSIIDLSSDGLCLQYINNRERPYQSNRLGILNSNKPLFIDKLPFETVYDVEVTEDDLQPRYLPLRRCGVRFKELTRDQKADLKNLIQNYTTSC